MYILVKYLLLEIQTQDIKYNKISNFLKTKLNLGNLVLNYKI